MLKGPLFAWSPVRDSGHVSATRGREKGGGVSASQPRDSWKRQLPLEGGVNPRRHRQRLCEDPSDTEGILSGLRIPER